MMDERTQPGTAEDRRHVHQDTPRWAMWVLCLFAGCLIAVGAASTAIVQVRGVSQDNRATIRQIARESTERRDQICTAAEREDASDVERLRRTYDYLAGLTRRQRRSPLNRTILQSLPQAEQDARTAVAPAFCNEPGVGLPEPKPGDPDGRLPRRPRVLRAH